MRSTILATVLAFSLAACGDDTASAKKAPAPAPAPAPAAPKQPEFKSDPKGTVCIACSIRTDGPACKKCKTTLKAEIAPVTPKTAASGDVGKSALAPLFACPKEGCTFTDARKGTCLKHGDTEMKVQWFGCAACGVNEPVAGKCAKCGSALVKTLK